MSNNLTRNGVCHELSKSPYSFTEIIDGNKTIFFFSSRLHLNNFIAKRNENYNMIYNYLYKRFKYKVDCRMLADCNLYSKIENRGFYIKYKDKEFKCPSSITLSGDSKMNENYAVWQEILMLN